MDNAFVLEKVIDKRLERGLELYMAFVDVRKVFDTIATKFDWKSLKDSIISHRGIMVLSTKGRIYGKILKGIHGGEIMHRPHLYFTTSNWKKAYDSEQQTRLWNAMRNLEIPNKIIEAARELYKGYKVAVKIVNTLTH